MKLAAFTASEVLKFGAIALILAVSILAAAVGVILFIAEAGCAKVTSEKD